MAQTAVSLAVRDGLAGRVWRLGVSSVSTSRTTAADAAAATAVAQRLGRAEPAQH